MPRVRSLTDAGVRRLRAGAQLLHRPRRRSVADLVRYLGAVQAQVPSAAGLALRARTEGLTVRRVDRARLHDRSIVLTWALRGTLHLIAAEDHGWLVPLATEPSIANAHRRLREEGVPADAAAGAVRHIEAMLGREGPLSRREIAERLGRRRIRTGGQAIAHLLWLASAKGVICHGPDRGRTQLFVLCRDWLGEPNRMDQEAALLELAIRHLTAHGPAAPEDLAFWSGLRIGQARLAWQGIRERLVEVPTIRGRRWLLRTQKREAPHGLVRLLPSFDEYLLGWKDRGPAVADEDWRKVNRGGGWIHPVVVVDGRVVGTWRAERTSARVRIEVHPFSALSTAARRGATAEERDLAAFWEVPAGERGMP